MRNLSVVSLLVLLSSALPVAAQSATTTTTNYTITVTVTPAVSSLALSNTAINTAGSNNTGAVVGAVSVVMDPPGSTFAGQITLGGADGAKFAMTNGGKLPCNLVVGSASLPAGTYQVSLSAQ